MVEIIEAKIIKVPRNVYRVIRSFVDSSLKTEYLFNVGIKIGSLVTFRKFGKWELRIYMFDKGPTAELLGYGVKVVYDPDISLDVSSGKKIVFSSNDIKEIMMTYIESDGLFMDPIPLIDLVEKLDYYIDAVKNSIRKQLQIEQQQVAEASTEQNTQQTQGEKHEEEKQCS